MKAGVIVTVRWAPAVLSTTNVCDWLALSGNSPAFSASTAAWEPPLTASWPSTWMILSPRAKTPSAGVESWT